MLMKDIQKEILENKKKHGFNTTNIEQEFCRLYGEVGEAYDAYCKGTDNFAEELADVANYCILMADACELDLDEIICEKVKKNNKKS